MTGRHGDPTLCTRCKVNPRKVGQRWCLVCAAEYQREHPLTRGQRDLLDIAAACVRAVDRGTAEPDIIALVEQLPADMLATLRRRRRRYVPRGTGSA